MSTALLIIDVQNALCSGEYAAFESRRVIERGSEGWKLADGHSTLDNGILTAAQISARHTVTLANISSFGPRVTPQSAAGIRARPGPPTLR